MFTNSLDKNNDDVEIDLELNRAEFPPLLKITQYTLAVETKRRSSQK